MLISFFVIQAKAENPFLTYNDRPPYLGCWAGMHGGKLKITAHKIYDLGSHEHSSYKRKTTVEKEPKGLPTGEKYLFEAANDFPKSFLAKWISFSFNRDSTAGITAYNSQSDYVKDKFTGMGLFQKTPCKSLK